jgi:Do/DeqQ family serine protease
MKSKKTLAKFAFIILGIFCASFFLFSFSCSSEKTAAKSKNTVFADNSPAVSMPEDALAVVEALQSAFRSVSSQVLPSVVEIDVVETKTVEVNNFMNGFPFNYFFNYGDESQGNTQEYKQSGLGSGVIVRNDKNTYYVLTNHHVAGSATEITVKLHDNREFKGTLVGSDDRKDIALVSFECTENLPVAKLGDSDAVQIGDICFAMGTPMGYASSVTQGIVSATGRTGSSIGNISDFIQTDAAINQGNSGGPLVNIYGEIIGINTWIASSSGGSQGLGFSIPINNIKKAIDDFIQDGKVTYGWMGVSLVEITEEYKKALGVEGQKGAFASQVFIDSPAAKGGLKPGDYVIELNGKQVKDVDQLVREVGDLTVGESAVFTVIRDGKELTLTCVIESRNDSVVSDSSKQWPGFVALPLTDDLKKELKITDNKVEGVVVSNLQSKSPASALGLQSGDVILTVNDVEVKTIEDFYSVLADEATKEVWYDIYRNGMKMSTLKYKF